MLSLDIGKLISCFLVIQLADYAGGCIRASGSQWEQACARFDAR